MEMVLILYAICASALVIWSTLPGDDDLRRTCSHAAVKRKINFVAVPSSLLNDWDKRNPDLLIFDLCTNSERNVRQEDISGLLPVTTSDLANLLKSLPPGSKVVFSCADVIERFNAQAEGAFLQLGIETRYWRHTSAVTLPPSLVAKRVSLGAS